MSQTSQKNRNPRRYSITALILGALFSVFLVVGRSFRLRTDFSLITEAPWKAVLFFLLFWAVFFCLLSLLYRWMDTLPGKAAGGAGTEPLPGGQENTVSAGQAPAHASALDSPDLRHPVLTRMLLLLAMWAAFQVWFLPGNIPSDPWHQLSMFLDYSSWNTHHPFFASVTLGAIYSVGLKIGGMNLGTFFCVLAQDLLGAFTFASMIAYVRRRSKSRVLSICCLLLVGLVPAFPAYMCSLGKDAFYLSYLLLFLLSYVRILLKDEQKYTKLILIIGGTLACMQRHDALYLVVPTLFVLVFLVEGKQQRRLILLSFAAVLFLSVSERLFVKKVLNLHTDRQTEALSIPLQQIGRYVMKHEKELTPEEIAVIDAVVKYEGMGERYDPTHSNSIKNHSRKGTTRQDWIRFFRLWAEKLADDPLTYVEATMNFVFGYTDPAYIRKESLGMYISDGNKDLVFATYVLPISCQRAARSYVAFWRTYLPFRIFMAPASYYWAYLILLGAVLRKKRNRKHAWFFVFPFLVFAICVASPICGSIRYSMPALTALPLFLCVTLESCRSAGCITTD